MTLERFSAEEMVVGVYDSCGQPVEEVARMMDTILATIDHNLSVDGATDWEVPFGGSWHGSPFHKVSIARGLARQLEAGPRSDMGYAVTVSGEVHGHVLTVHLEAGSPVVGRTAPQVRVSVRIRRDGQAVHQRLVLLVMGSIVVCTDPVMVTAVPLERIGGENRPAEPAWVGWFTPWSDRVWLSERVLDLKEYHPDLEVTKMGSGLLLSTGYAEGQEEMAASGQLPDLTGLKETLAYYKLQILPHR